MTAPIRHTAGWFFGITLVCVAAVGVALVSQHVFNMQPCPWCALQRLILLSLAGVSLLTGILARSAPATFGRRIGAAVALVLALAGVMAALWQHFRAASSVSCNLTVADKILSGLQLDRLLPGLFEPRASCADAAVNLLGVPYDFWSLALFVLVALAAARLMGRR